MKGDFQEVRDGWELSKSLVSMAFQSLRKKPWERSCCRLSGSAFGLMRVAVRNHVKIIVSDTLASWMV